MRNLMSKAVFVLSILAVLLAGCSQGRSIADLIKALKPTFPR
jgi:hypothetical protein